MYCQLETSIQPEMDFDPETSTRTFRIMTSDYESTLLLELIDTINEQAPHITLDLITPSDVTFHDVEQGRVDMAINRFDDPLSFHQKLSGMIIFRVFAKITISPASSISIINKPDRHFAFSCCSNLC